MEVKYFVINNNGGIIAEENTYGEAMRSLFNHTAYRLDLYDTLDGLKFIVSNCIDGESKPVYSVSAKKLIK